MAINDYERVKCSTCGNWYPWPLSHDDHESYDDHLTSQRLQLQGRNDTKVRESDHA